ncbi:mucin-2-like [Ptychodera flava]|uniref:mucin-2-like n=1 Tax=Ptychodera flava TaxID=63121 RepID=UPI00396A5B6F
MNKQKTCNVKNRTHPISMKERGQNYHDRTFTSINTHHQRKESAFEGEKQPDESLLQTVAVNYSVYRFEENLVDQVGGHESAVNSIQHNEEIEAAPVIPQLPTFSPTTLSATMPVTARPALPITGFCNTWGQIHYRTFDGYVYSFEGVCTYTLVRDCFSDTFKIYVANDRTCTPPYNGCDRTITIDEGSQSSVLQLSRVDDEPVVTLAGVRLTVPADIHGYIIERVAGYILVKSTIGFKLIWNGFEAVYVEIVDNELFGKTCGLCGHYNNDPTDDLTTSTGLALSPGQEQSFGVTWKVPDMSCPDVPYDPTICTDPGAFNHNGMTQQDFAKLQSYTSSVCNLLNENPFCDCHMAVDPTPYIRACERDVCACDVTGNDCMCSTFTAYAKECSKRGVLLDWRLPNLCPVNCTNGMVYDNCGSTCPQTCRTSLYNCDSNHCLEGCHCPAGTYLHEDECLSRSQCPCNYHGYEYPAGSTITHDCNECECADGRWDSCTTNICDGTCTLSGVQYYRTFDGRPYDFVGECSYTLMKDCFSEQNFYHIIVEISGCGENGHHHACSKSIIIEFGDDTVRLREHQVSFNGNDINHFPFSTADIYIEKVSSIYTQVALSNGIHVYWDNNLRAHVKVSTDHFHRTCGLCGTFNNNQQDDFYTMAGDIETSPESFANKYKLVVTCDDVVPEDTLVLHPCDLYSQRQIVAEEHCGMLKTDPVFTEIVCPYGQVYRECASVCNVSCEAIHSGRPCDSECVPGCRCPDGMVTDRQGNCILPSSCPCEHNGIEYRTDDVINRGCGYCQCQGGSWSCVGVECPGNSCPVNQVYTECVTTCPATCSNMHQYQGCSPAVCEAGCQCNNQTVWNGFECVPPSGCPCHHGGRSYQHGQTIQIDCNRCQCDGTRWICETEECSGKGSSRHRVQLVKGMPPEVTFGQGHGFALSEVGQFLFVHTSIGLTVMWDHGTRVYVKLSPTHRGLVEGLCGNFNGDQNDDFKPPTGGFPLTLPEEFGNSWKVLDYCPEVPVIPSTCELHPERANWAKKSCSVIKSDLFRPCHSEVPYQTFYTRCEYDACGCDTGGDCECLCTAIALYAHECSVKGVHIKWRSQELCPIQCEGCLTYSPCISVCNQTCANYYRRGSDDQCYDVCVEGCECPYGEYWDGKDCVTECPTLPPPTTVTTTPPQSTTTTWVYEPTTTTATPTRGPPSTTEVPTTTTRQPTTTTQITTSVPTTTEKSTTSTTTTEQTTTTAATTTVSTTEKTTTIIYEPTTTTSPPTTTTSVPSTTVLDWTTPGTCVCDCEWTEWMDDEFGNKIDPEAPGEFELIPVLRNHYNFCESPVDIECALAVPPHVPYDLTGQDLTCDVNHGLVCFHVDQRPPLCYNYGVRFKCCDPDCECTTIPTTRVTTTSTTTEPPTVTTPVTPETTSVSSTTTVAPTTPICQCCEWTEWMDDDERKEDILYAEGEFELQADLRHLYDFCESPEDIQCRLAVEPHLPYDRTGQTLSCEVDPGLECYHVDQRPPLCYDYEVRFLCCWEPCDCNATTAVPTTTTASPTTTLSTTTEVPTTTTRQPTTTTQTTTSVPTTTTQTTTSVPTTTTQTTTSVPTTTTQTTTSVPTTTTQTTTSVPTTTTQTTTSVPTTTTQTTTSVPTTTEKSTTGTTTTEQTTAATTSTVTTTEDVTTEKTTTIIYGSLVFLHSVIFVFRSKLIKMKSSADLVEHRKS